MEMVGNEGEGGVEEVEDGTGVDGLVGSSQSRVNGESLLMTANRQQLTAESEADT